MTMATDRTLQDLAQEALDVQNACNLMGVVSGMHRAMVALSQLGVNGTDALNTHSITKLWADKVVHLAGLRGTSCVDWNNIYEEIETLAKGSK
jgi:hypothetical protein